MEKVKVHASPGRLINAVANMGYDHEVAICDLIDNSIDANATTVNVYLASKRNEGGKKDTIYQYIIADDGCGMDRDTIINAFILGSIRQYPQHALGKFGIGLKSAGLSLGSRIVVVTKIENMDAPLCGILSRKEIEHSGEYTIDLGDAPAPYNELWERYAPKKEKGTILLVEELNTPPFKDFIAYLKRHCGMVYHMFLEDSGKPFAINVEDAELELSPDSQVKPIDPLFLKEAELTKESLIPETWDGKTLYVLLEPNSPLVVGKDSAGNNIECEIAATHLINPDTFHEKGKQKDMRDKYCIGQDPYTKRSRHGFYVYRNRRIIIMAELFWGLVAKEQRSWAFKGRLMFDESADSVLSLDVKKRHCKLTAEARTNLQTIIKPIHTKSAKAWREAGKKASAANNARKEEIAQQSITNTPVANLDYSPGIPIESEEAIQNRKKKENEIRAEALKVIQESEVTEEVLEQKAQHKDIVSFVKGIQGNRMWQVYPAKTVGLSETLLNEHHSWIKAAYEEAEKAPQITIILHQIFTVLAKAELEIKRNQWEGIPSGMAEKVFDEFRNQASIYGEVFAKSLQKELRKFDDIIAEEEESE